MQPLLLPPFPRELHSCVSQAGPGLLELLAKRGQQRCSPWGVCRAWCWSWRMDERGEPTAAGTCCTGGCSCSSATRCACGRSRCSPAAEPQRTGWRAAAWGSTSSTATTQPTRPSCTAAASSSPVRLRYRGASLHPGLRLGPAWAAGIIPGRCFPTQSGLSILDTLFSPLPRVFSLLLLVSRRLPANSGLGSTEELWLLFCLHREVQIEGSVHKCRKST